MRIQLKGASDLHIHSSPSIFERIADDVENALAARERGMIAIMYKSHHENTVSRAYHTMKQVPGIQVFGGICLNKHVGGINPFAVKVALEQGAKQVWMPTFHSYGHEIAFGKTGYEMGSMQVKDTFESISVLDENEQIIEPLKEILNLIAQHNAIFGTSHLSKKEIFTVMEYIERTNNLKKIKILVTHPFFKVPDLNIDEAKKLVDKGAWLDLHTLYSAPFFGRTGLDITKEAIELVGAQHCILSSDAGPPYKPIAPECLRMFAQALHEKGVSVEQLKLMMCDNPRILLGL